MVTEPRAIPAKTEPALRASTETPQPSQPVERVPSQAAKETPRLQPAGGEPAEPLPAIVPAFGEAPPAFTASEDALPGKRSFAHAVISAVVSLLVQNPLVRLF